MTIEIKNRWTNRVIHTVEADTLRGANLTGANLTDANLADANLRGANLRGANLRGANLRGANLTDANLTDANLTGANLTDANLTDANLTDANLTDANLTDANLADANLTDANLRGANLRGANLTDANLRGANLTPIKDDMFAVLLRAIPEIPALKLALQEGRIDGSTYEGDCACLAGTVANTRECDWRSLGFTDSSRPIERFFLMIRPGDTPENSGPAKLALEWIEEFQSYLSVKA